MARGVRYFILESEGVVSGCVALESASSDVCYLERLGVLPHQRRRGLGKAMVGHALSEAKRLGARHVGIGIIAQDKELNDWYKKLGFLEMETKKFAHLPFQVTFMSCATGLESEYAAMARDEKRENEAMEWAETTFKETTRL